MIRPGFGRRRSALDDLRDPRVLEASQELGLQLEASAQLRQRRAEPQDLQRHAPAGILLLGFEHEAHPAGAQQAHDLEGTDPIGKRAHLVGGPLREARRRRVLQELRLRVFRREHALDLGAQGWIVGAGGVEIGGLIVALAVTRPEEQLLHTLVARGVWHPGGKPYTTEASGRGACSRPLAMSGRGHGVGRTVARHAGRRSCRAGSSTAQPLRWRPDQE